MEAHAEELALRKLSTPANRFVTVCVMIFPAGARHSLVRRSDRQSVWRSGDTSSHELAMIVREPVGVIAATCRGTSRCC